MDEDTLFDTSMGIVRIHEPNQQFDVLCSMPLRVRVEFIQPEVAGISKGDLYIMQSYELRPRVPHWEETSEQ